MEPAILAALSERPMHGYEVISYLEKRSQGFWRPSPGSVYPTLQLLEEKDLVTYTDHDGEKVYELTALGTTEAEASRDHLKGVFDRFKSLPIARIAPLSGALIADTVRYVIARSASSVQGFSMIILFPLTFLSNAFVSVDTLPNWLQWFVNINPISHLITAIRELVNHSTIGNDFWLSIVGALVILAIFAPLTIRAYMRKA